jgi:hypothetical protein
MLPKNHMSPANSAGFGASTQRPAQPLTLSCPHNRDILELKFNGGIVRGAFPAAARGLLWGVQEQLMWAFLSNPRFWDMKVRIAVLTLATFIAMC